MMTLRPPWPPTVERLGRCIHCTTEIRQVRLADYPREIWMPVTCERCSEGNTVAETMPADPDKVRRDRRERLLNIPVGFEAATLGTWTGRTVDPGRRRKVELAHRFIEVFRDPPPAALLIVFQGGHGTGKTHLAVGIGRELALDFDVDARCTSFPDVVRELRAGQDGTVEQADREIQVLQRYRMVGLLILDDVSHDATADLGDVAIHLLDIVTDRMAAKRPTIVTTRDDLEGLRRMLGPTLTDQVIHCRGIWPFGNDPFPTTTP